MAGCRAVAFGVACVRRNLKEMLSYNVVTHRYHLYS